MGNLWPIRYRWRWVYVLGLLILAVAEGAAIWLAWQDGDWSRTLTHQMAAIAWRNPWIGIPALAFLLWLVLHFAPLFWRTWRERQSKPRNSNPEN